MYDNDRDSYSRDDMDDGSDNESRKFIGSGSMRKKPCRFCNDAEMIMDYKNAGAIRSFLSEHGKIVPRRISGNCAFHQRRLTVAIKQSRQIALLGYVTPGY